MGITIILGILIHVRRLLELLSMLAANLDHPYYILMKCILIGTIRTKKQLCERRYHSL